MTGPFSTRRRADEFDAALARPFTERDAESFADLLAVVRDLRSMPAPAPRPDFVSALRSQLMVEADTVLLPQTERRPTDEEQRLDLSVGPRRRDRRLATVLGGAALIGATASMAVAAQTALPGEALYAVKLALEEVETTVASTDTARGEVLLANARGRLDEVHALAERGTPSSLSAIESTLESFSDQADEASAVLLSAYARTGEETVITDLRSFASTSMDTLSGLRASLPVSTHDDLVDAGERLAEIDRLAREACISCGGAPTSVPPALVMRDDDPSGIETLVVATSQDPGLLEKVRSGPRSNTTVVPGPASTPDAPAVEVPGLQALTPTRPQTPPSNGAKSGLPGPKVDGTTNVSDVTKLLTGDLSPSVTGSGAVNDLFNGLDAQLGGQVGGQVGGPISGQTGGPPAGPVDAQHDGQVGGQVGGAISGQTGGPLDGPVGGQLDGSVDGPLVGPLDEAADDLKGTLDGGTGSLVP